MTKNKKTTKAWRTEIHENLTRLGVVAFFVIAVSVVGGIFQNDNVVAQSESVERTAMTASVPTNQDEITARTAEPPSTSETSGEAEDESESSNEAEAEDDSVAIPEPNEIRQAEKEAEKCVKGEGEDCRNKCSTTYVIPNINEGYAVQDCYGEGEDVTKGISKALKELAVCITENAQLQTPVDTLSEQLNKAMCISEVKVSTETDGKISISDETAKKTLSVPSVCKDKVQRIVDIRAGKVDIDTSATSGDNNSCAWHGAVVCYATGVSLGDNTPTYTCARKTDPAPKNTGSACTGKAGIEKKFCEYTNKTNQVLQDLLSKLGGAGNAIGNFTSGLGKGLTGALGGTGTGIPGLGGGTSGGSSSGGSTSGSSSNCPTGYSLTTRDGELVCAQNGGTDTLVQPQCLLVASTESVKAGESVTLQWRTANAQDVDIAGLENNVAESGQQSVAPTETTTYTLVATGSGSTANKKTCAVTVTVDGGTTNSTYTPTFSCTPGVIQKGSNAQLQWSCPDSTEGSIGLGFDTKDARNGSVSVSPDYNTEYTAQCKIDGEIVGEKTCAVTVGESLFDIVVYPTIAKRGDRVRVSWGSLFMSSCKVEGPRDFEYERTQGVVVTEPFSLDITSTASQNIKSAIYNIQCKNQFDGSVVSRDITVEFDDSE